MPMRPWKWIDRLAGPALVIATIGLPVWIYLVVEIVWGRDRWAASGSLPNGSVQSAQSRRSPSRSDSPASRQGNAAESSGRPKRHRHCREVARSADGLGDGR